MIWRVGNTHLNYLLPVPDSHLPLLTGYGPLGTYFNLRSKGSMFKSLAYQATLKLDQALTHIPSIGKFRPLKGTFSAYERLKSGELTGEILL
jgi:hypothetical protein